MCDRASYMKMTRGTNLMQQLWFIIINISTCFGHLYAHLQPRIDLQIRKRKWGWLGHTLRKSSDDIARQALEWNPQGKRGGGRPKNTWRRAVLEEAKGVNKTWAEIKADAKNRVRWKFLVEALCSAAEWRDAIIIIIIIIIIYAHLQEYRLCAAAHGVQH